MQEERNPDGLQDVNDATVEQKWVPRFGVLLSW